MLDIEAAKNTRMITEESLHDIDRFRTTATGHEFEPLGESMIAHRGSLDDSFDDIDLSRLDPDDTDETFVESGSEIGVASSRDSPPVRRGRDSTNSGGEISGPTHTATRHRMRDSSPVNPRRRSTHTLVRGDADDVSAERPRKVHQQ